MDNLIAVGNRIELCERVKKTYEKDGSIRMYVSQVLDVFEETIQAAMPIYEGHLIPLEISTKYEAFFTTKKGLYRTTCEVVTRSKVNNIYMVELRPIEEFEKFQRREFFRLECSISGTIHILEEDEIKEYIVTSESPEVYTGESYKGVIVDISGGGAKFVVSKLYPKDTYIGLQFNISTNDGIRKVNVISKVVFSTVSNNKRDLFEHRIEFKNITKDNRELLIKFIFEEQRKRRQKERG